MNGNGSEVLRPVGAYALGVWIAITVWAALAEYVLPGRGQALGKLGSFHWVFLINLLPALLCAAGFAAGLFARRHRAQGFTMTGGMAVVLGLLFPLTLGLLRPAFAAAGHGLLPALVALTMLSTVGLAAAPAAVSPPGHEVGQEVVILEAMDRYMRAISANDLEAMASMQTPDGMTYRARSLPDGKAEIIGRPNSYWIDPARKDDRTFRERYWSPTVLIRGSIAVVWAPYEFQIDSKTSHCGVDVFNFIKVGDEWHVANSMWTVEPDACSDLRPENVSEIRPAG